MLIYCIWFQNSHVQFWVEVQFPLKHTNLICMTTQSIATNILHYHSLISFHSLPCLLGCLFVCLFVRLFVCLFLFFIPVCYFNLFHYCLVRLPYKDSEKCNITHSFMDFIILPMFNRLYHAITIHSTYYIINENRHDVICLGTCLHMLPPLILRDTY